jgi:hypothetical protein
VADRRRQGAAAARATLLLVLLSPLVFPAAASGQACVGRPVGGLAARALLAEIAVVRDSARSAGADAGGAFWANPGGFTAYSASYARRTVSGGDAHVAELQLLAELPSANFLPPGGGLCLTTGLAAAWHDSPDSSGEERTVALPAGFAAGMLVPLGPALRVYPYLNPRLVVTGSRGEAGGRARASFEGGLGFARRAIVGRVRLARIFGSADGTRPPFPELRAALELGIRF